MVESVTKIREEKNGTVARVSVLENQVIAISHNIEKLEHRVEDQYKTLHSRISELRDDVRSDIDSKHEKVIAKIESHNISSANKLDQIEEKITSIEQWRWMIMGAALVVGYVLAHIKVDNLF